jgi:hypothetical protein
MHSSYTTRARKSHGKSEFTFTRVGSTLKLLRVGGATQARARARDERSWFDAQHAARIDCKRQNFNLYS